MLQTIKILIWQWEMNQQKTNLLFKVVNGQQIVNIPYYEIN